MLRVGVLGTVRLELAGEPAALPHGVARQLLAYLTLHPGRHARTQVAGALWPDVPGHVALHRLRTTVWDLRHALPAAMPLLVQADGHELGLRPGVEVDLQEARALLDAGAAEAAFRLLEPGLAEEIASEWAEGARHDVEIWRLQVLDRLVHAADDLGVALAYARRRVALAPLSEVAHADVICLLLASGDRAGAMEAYERLRQALERELGAGPSAASRRLLAQIQGDEPLQVQDVGTPAVNGARRRARIPAPTTPLIGREREVSGLAALVRGHRLVSVVGPAGVGKSRIALALAEQHARHGIPVAVADLATTRRAEACDYVVAGALDVHAGPGRAIRDAVLDRLEVAPGLLVLDNCEHLVEPVRDLVGDVLRSSPATTVLTTSRSPLSVPGEHVMHVMPFPVPATDDADPALAGPAVQLLLGAARRRSPDAVGTSDELRGLVRLARRLDGLPLALELAGARIPSIGATSLADRLERGLDILSARLSDADRPGGSHHGRQDSLVGALDASTGLLSPSDRTLLGLVSVLPGPFPLAAVDELTSAAGLDTDCVAGMARLVEASLIQPHPGAPWGYSSLDTIRTYGRTLLDDETADAALDGLVRWAVRFAQEVRGREDTEEFAVHAEMTRFLPLVRAGLHLARDRGDLEAQRRIVTGVEGWSTWREQPEVWSWVRDLAAREPRDHPDAEVLRMGALASRRLGDMDLMRELTARCVAADPDGPDGPTAIEARTILALAERRWADARDLALLERSRPGRRVLAGVIAATASARMGRPQEALESARSARRGAERLGARSILAMAMLAEARACEAAHSPGCGDAAQSLADARTLAESVEMAELVAAIDKERGLLAMRRGEPELAVGPLIRACLHWLGTGNGLPVPSALQGLAGALRSTGRPDVADRLLESARDGDLTAAHLAAIVRPAEPCATAPLLVTPDDAVLGS